MGGDDTNNGISITRAGHELRVKEFIDHEYRSIFSFDYNSVNNIQVLANGGSDTITVSDNVN